MIYGISTHVFLPQRLHPGLLDALLAGGAQTIEVFAARYHFNYCDRGQVREIAAWFRDSGVTASLHQPLTADEVYSRHAGPTLNLIERDKGRRIEAMEEVKRALESAEQIPFKSCVLHLGMKGDAWNEHALEYALTAVEHLKAFAAPLGVTLLLENLQNDVTTPDHLLEILKVGHFDRVGVCLDVGHAHLSDDGVAGAVETLRHRIFEVHVHDNHGAESGYKDEHLWPGAGTIPWAKVWPHLESLRAETRGVLEIANDPAATVEDVSRRAEAVFSERRRLMEAAHSQA
jgi:sugar phosphate isomerase/epimerase